MDFHSKLNTAFSPRNHTAKEFLIGITKVFPNREIFLIPISHKCGYFTVPFPMNNTENRWCFTPSGRIAAILDKYLVFQPEKSDDVVYTRDGKVFRQLDEQKMIRWYSKYPILGK